MGDIIYVHSSHLNKQIDDNNNNNNNDNDNDDNNHSEEKSQIGTVIKEG